MTEVPRAYHHGDLKRALLDAAQAIVANEGIHAVTMSSVALQSGVSSGAPYRHFSNRLELLRALSARAQQAIEARLIAAAADAPSPLEGFRRTGVEYVRFAVDEPALFAVLARGELKQRAEPGASDSPDQAFADNLERLLAQEPDAPLDPSHPLLQQLAARCMVHGLAHYFVEGTLAAIGVGSDQAGRIAEALTQALGTLNVAEPFGMRGE